ncbi:hypothetical protein ACLESD_35420 [Pyxidicoccus sp. 3LFB2]
MKRITLAAALAVILAAPVALAQDGTSPPGPTLQSLLMSAAVAVTPVVATALAGLVAAALMALTKKLQAHAGESKLAQVATRASMLAEGIVRDLKVTLKPKLEEASADGVLTAGSVGTFLSGLIEAALDRMKASRAAATADEVVSVARSLGAIGSAAALAPVTASPQTPRG